MSIIRAAELRKTFFVNERKHFTDYFKIGLKANKKRIDAIDGISFKIEKGETVGLIGLNGAGKSTLIKMMTGILLPTSGIIEVLGKDPFEKRLENNKRISAVFGQRCKLRWDVSPLESYKLIKEMYEVSEYDYKMRLQNLKSILGLDSFINNPVRTLSLGQKMKAELAAALLYEPDIIFLDEPTIGLDILTKDSILKFLSSIKGKTTLILTTHDFDDIEEICDRIIILNKGKLSAMDQKKI